MAGSLTVRQASLVLPDRVVTGDLVVEDGVISEIAPRIDRAVGHEVDGRGHALLPGVVDAHVRLDACEDLGSLSHAAVAGGVTTVLGVRNATTRAELIEELTEGEALAGVHFALGIRATEDNLGELVSADRARGIYVSGEVLHSPHAEAVFAGVDRRLWVDNHDPARERERRQLYPDLSDPGLHPKLLDIDGALASTRRAIELASKHGRATHLLHVGSAEEAELLRTSDRTHVSAAVRPVHLTLDDSAYAELGTRAVTAPPIRSPRHAEALWRALHDGTVEVVASGHHPVRSDTKDRPWPYTHPGMPTIEWMLPVLLDAAHSNRCTLSDVARWTSEAPARLLGVARKGRLEVGYDGDLVLIDPNHRQVIGHDAPVHSQAGWSPWHGRTVHGWPVLTVLLGEPVFRSGEWLPGARGRPL